METLASAVEYVSQRRRLQVALLLLIVLAYTLPFVGQAIHIDAQLDIEWAKQQLEHPLWHHIPDYDYFGFHYDEFHDTHPRLQSAYLNLFVRLNGGDVSDTLLHLAMIPFPLIAAVSIYSLARRFGANAFIASMLMLVSPAFLVNAHLIMKDIPGIAMWLAGVALFIRGADDDRLAYMLGGSVCLTACIFIFYQGLSALPLLLLYLLLQRKVGKRSVVSLSVPVIIFAAFISAHVAYYSALPTLKYPPPIGLPLDFDFIIRRFRGVITMIGGAALLPGLGIWLFTRSRFSTYAVAAVFVIATAWMSILFILGDTLVEHLLLMPLALASGTAILLGFMTRFGSSFRPALKGRARRDDLFLSTWFLGVWFYCTVLLPYASPRFMIPLLPPLAIITARLMAERWQSDRRLYIRAVSLVLVLTLVLSLSVAMGENTRASAGREQALWVAENLEDAGGTVWYSGYLGFQYYVERYTDHPMLIVTRNEPVKGDIIVESVYNGRWPYPDRIADRIELVETIDFGRKWPVNTFNDSHIAWIGHPGVMMPYGFSGPFTERLYVYEVVEDPVDARPIFERLVEWDGWIPKRIIDWTVVWDGWRPRRSVATD